MENEDRTSRGRAQFGLPALLEYVTLCAILSAFSPVTGLAAGVLLMLLALALWARAGALALATLVAISLAADRSAISHGGGPMLQRQIAVLLLAAALCGWYLLRRRFRP